MGVMGIGQQTPAQLADVANPKMTNANRVMEKIRIGTMDDANPQVETPRASNTPPGWNIVALGEPHSTRDGIFLNVMVVSNVMAAISGGTGGFAEQAAVEKAPDLGLAGIPVIVNSSTPFPVDPVTFEKIIRAFKGCKWGKIVRMTTGR